MTGFNAQGQAQIWTVDGTSAPKNYNAMGLFAIGSGARAALSTMAFHVDAGHVRFKHHALEPVLYCALTAKFMAESATGVGKSTFAIIFRAKRPDQRRLSYISVAGIAAVRDYWQKEGAPRFPKDFINSEMPGLIKF